MKRTIFSILFVTLTLFGIVLNWSCQLDNSSKNPSFPNALSTMVTGITPVLTSTPVNTPTNTPTPCSVLNGLMGDTTVEPNNLSSPTTLYMNRYISPSTASYVLSLQTNVTTSTGSYELAVYSDNSGTPGTLLSETGTKTISSSGTQLALLSGPLRIQGSTYYWLAVLTDQPVKENPNGTATAIQTSVNFGLLPTTYTGAAPAAGYQFTLNAGICQ